MLEPREIYISIKMMLVYLCDLPILQNYILDGFASGFFQNDPHFTEKLNSS